MNLLELKQVIDTIMGYVDEPERVSVRITTNEPSIGGRASSGVRSVHLGFDWEMNQLRIEPDEFLRKESEWGKKVNEFRPK